jgi:arylsulfatase A-like enzyme
MKTTLLVCAGLLAVSACRVAAQAGPAAPGAPNFLFVVIDDLNTVPGFLADEPGSALRTIYPDPARRAEARKRLTPNIDRLAAEGRPFHRAFCPAPVCSPSRTAILTGVPPARSGCYDNYTCFRDVPWMADVVTLPQYLRENGWFTAAVGKVFHHAMPLVENDGRHVDWPDAARSWDAVVPRQEGSTRNPKEPPGRYSASEGYTRYGPTTVPRARCSDHENAAFIAGLLTEGVASLPAWPDGAKQTVTLPGDRPFLLACGIFAPHLAWFVPAEFYQRFPVDEMAIDETTIAAWRRDVEDLPANARSWTAENPRSNNVLLGFLQRATALDGPDGAVRMMKELCQAYLAATSFADACVGVVLDGLAASKHASNTVVVLWSDNGFHLGEKFRLAKSTLWDEAARTVLVVRQPGMPKAGRAARGTVSLQGLYPTVVELAGLRRPMHVDGRSLVPWLRNPELPAAAPVVTTEMFGNHAVRDDRWCYIRYASGDEELYDDIADPDQLVNLASRPDHAAEKARLFGWLPEYTAENAAKTRR